ncbi:hypothetical protein, partial [Viridibacillus soli]
MDVPLPTFRGNTTCRIQPSSDGFTCTHLNSCLARCPPDLTEEERGFVAQWHQEDNHTKHIYQALQQIRSGSNGIKFMFVVLFLRLPRL